MKDNFLKHKTQIKKTWIRTQRKKVGKVGGWRTKIRDGWSVTKVEKKTDRLTQQWGVERVVLLVAVETQDTFDLHIWGHERGWGHLWQKLLPWLLAGPTECAQIKRVGNINAHVCQGRGHTADEAIRQENIHFT